MNAGPNFDELVGTDLPAAERERLLRVHELLIAAGPPPQLEGRSPPSTAEPARRAPRRRRVALVAFACLLAVAAFAGGGLVGDRWDEPGTFDVVTLAGAGAAPDASASLEIFDVDKAGNWPMELSVERLAPSQSGRPYELWLTKDGSLAVLCGSFRVGPDGTTKVPMNAPYKLRDFDDWVVVEEGSETPLLTT